MAKALKKPRKKATNGYQMPDPLPEGEILIDIKKNRWKLGKSIGKGGFGEIYSAKDASSSSSTYPYVIKVEPHGNGPLFVEMHFYMKNARQEDVETFMKKHKLKSFGMPIYLGSGSHETGSSKYRFIAMEKFGIDVDKLRQQAKGLLPVATVFQLAWQITYVLEYIHEQGYVHADIKGGNVLLGAKSDTKNQAYLLDFGLASKFTTDKEFKPNPKKAHDGTIEYLSRDAHQGVQTRRGDLEILGYNIILWMGGTLPWESKLDDPKTVQQLKEDSFKDIPRFVKICLKKDNGVLIPPPWNPNGERSFLHILTDPIVKFLQYVNKLKFNEEPDYKKIRKLFEQEININGGSVNAPLDFQNVRKRRSGGDIGEKKTEDDVVVKKPVMKREKKHKAQEVSDGVEVMTDAMKEILAKKKEREAKKKPVQSKIKSGDDLENYNQEMIDIKRRIDTKKSKKGEDMEVVRSRRNLPVLNYDERTPKPLRRK